MPYRLHINGMIRRVDAPPDMPLLWVLRKELTGQAIEFIDGAVQQSNFNDFPLARMPMTPDIEIAWVKFRQAANRAG